MSVSFEERKFQYIQAIEEEYATSEKNYWQQPPSYILTGDYALRYDKPLISDEPLIIKKTKREGAVIAVMIIVAAVLLYMIGKKESGFAYVGFLLLVLIVILPILLNNKMMIRISRDGVRLFSLDNDIKWKWVVLTYIKQVQEEDVKQFFIVHYYDEETDEFRRSEIELNGLVSPAFLSAAIEAYKNI
ncbi:MAG: hypothetical protein ABUT20_28990 [Bacteroidota bacterium]